MKSRILLMAALLTGCDAWTYRPVHFVPANEPAAPPTDAASIQLFFLGRPSAPYRVLGTFHTENRDVGALRAAAAKRGCHALILQTPARFIPSPQPCWGWESPTIEAVCVRLSE